MSTPWNPQSKRTCRASFARLRPLGLASFTAAALLVVPKESNALIVPIDIGAVRVVIQFHDSGSGPIPVRVWLGAQFTKGSSYQQVKDAVTTGALQGFTIAHESDVRVLFADAGLAPFAHTSHFGSFQVPSAYTPAFTALCQAFAMGNCAPAVLGANSTTRRGRTADLAPDGVNQVSILLEQVNFDVALRVEASIRLPGDVLNVTIPNTLADETVFAWLYIDL